MYPTSPFELPRSHLVYYVTGNNILLPVRLVARQLVSDLTSLRPSLSLWLRPLASQLFRLSCPKPIGKGFL